MKIHPIPFAVALLAAAAVGWGLGRQGHAPAAAHSHNHAAVGDSATASNKKLLYYQSPMHPWIRSDQPGVCTICGMKLVPVYEGDAPQAAAGDSVSLTAESVNVLSVATEPVVLKPLKRTLRVAGQIDDDDSRHRRLSSYVDGRIEKLMVHYVGAEVAEGQALAQIYSPTLLTARDEYILLARQAGESETERERLTSAARQRLERLGFTPRQIRALPGVKNPPNYVEIVAPLGGTVVTRSAYEGQYVKEGDTLFEIGDFSKMWFIFDAYERDLAWIKVGQMVEVKTPSVPGQSFRAPIDFIDPNLNRETRTAKVRVILENPLVEEAGARRRLLLHKTYAEGIIEVQTPATLLAPRQAVLDPSGNPQVYVARTDGVYEPRNVKLGRAGDEEWEILDGVAEGEKVVVNGNLLIDAQSQLQRGDRPLPAAAQPASPESMKALGAFVKSTESVTAALAADDLPRYNAAALELQESLSPLGVAFGAEVQMIVATGHLPPAADLTAARKDFYAFSMAASAFLHDARGRDSTLAGVKIYECPMVKGAVPGAKTNKGWWLQGPGPIRNPYFGAEMIDCGSEVRP